MRPIPTIIPRVKGRGFPHTLPVTMLHTETVGGAGPKPVFWGFCTAVLTCPCKAFPASYTEAHTCKGSSELLQLLVSPLLNRSRVSSTKCFNFMQWKHLKTHRHFVWSCWWWGITVVHTRSFYWTLNWYCNSQPFDQIDLPPCRVLK